jgi:pyridoxal phosphate enzyme (YggS family)
MNHIESNLKLINDRIYNACRRSGRSSEEVTLVAVTKTVNAEAVRTAYDLGLRHFGENRVQEATAKIEELTQERPAITWHMIGHLQTNKAGQAARYFDIIESIDSVRLANLINGNMQQKMPVLLQVNVAGEDTKSGFELSEIHRAVAEIGKLDKLEIKGLMTIAPLTGNPEEVRPVFRKLRELRDDLKLEQLSMGMTDDFEVAIEEGATIVRIGRAIFGERSISCE